MLESLIFIILVLVGGLCLIIGLILIADGLLRKSKSQKNIGIGFLIIPLVSLALIFWWYGIKIPNFNENEKSVYVGIYKTNQSNSYNKNKQILSNVQYSLRLNSDGTFELADTPGIEFNGKGIWKTGGIDGHFEFYDENNKLVGWGSPFNYDGTTKIIFNLYDDKEVRFVKINP